MVGHATPASTRLKTANGPASESEFHLVVLRVPPDDLRGVSSTSHKLLWVEAIMNKEQRRELSKAKQRRVDMVGWGPRTWIMWVKPDG